MEKVLTLQSTEPVVLQFMLLLLMAQFTDSMPT
jgi:hypothetical protein